MSYNYSNDTPIYLQIVDIIITDIVSGNVKPGERLPSVREYSTLFKANPNTIAKSLTILEDLKLIYTERTNGKFVTSDLALINKKKKEIFELKFNNFIKEMNDLGFTYQDIENKLKREK